MATKQCTGPCGEVKPLSEFGKKTASPDGLKPRCLICTRKESSEYYYNNREQRRESDRQWQLKNPGRKQNITAQWFAENPTYAQEYKLQQKYGMSLVNYLERLTKQNGVCAICHKAETAKYRGKVRCLAVDHCHTTGNIRGLLCSACNTGIGSLRHDTAQLQAAIDYLTRDPHAEL